MCRKECTFAQIFHNCAMNKGSSFNEYIHQAIINNWDSNALTDYQGQTLQYHDVARKIAKLHIAFENTGIRKGDNSQMAMIELVDYNENMLKENKPVKAKTTRRSRAKKATAETEAKPVEAKAEEEPKAEEPKAE